MKDSTFSYFFFLNTISLHIFPTYLFNIYFVCCHSSEDLPAGLLPQFLLMFSLCILPISPESLHHPHMQDIVLFCCILFHLGSFHFISLHFTLFHFISLYFTSFHFTSLHFISLHFISLNFTSFHLISLYFTLFYCLLVFILILLLAVKCNLQYVLVFSPYGRCCVAS